jgi:hypothetical protein
VRRKKIELLFDVDGNLNVKIPVLDTNKKKVHILPSLDIYFSDDLKIEEDKTTKDTKIYKTNSSSSSSSSEETDDKKKTKSLSYEHSISSQIPTPKEDSLKSDSEQDENIIF